MLDYAEITKWLQTYANFYESPHIIRYVKTLKAIESLLPCERVLDIGEESIFGRCITHFFPGTEVFNTNGDLRYWNGNLVLYPVILCMEVLEHIKDCEYLTEDRELAFDADQVSKFNWSGMKHLVHQMYHSLQTGGTLFISTPNAASHKSILNLLYGERPFFYEQHVREMSERELSTLMDTQPWSTRKISHEIVWDFHGVASKHLDLIETMTIKVRGVNAARGDCLFGKFTK